MITLAKMSMLLVYYGNLLTERQRAVLSLQVDSDYSLSEIAEREGITRQGAHDLIKRAQAQLIELEESLHMVKIARRTEESVSRLKALIGLSVTDHEKKTSLLQEADAILEIWEEDHGI